MIETGLKARLVSRLTQTPPAYAPLTDETATLTPAAVLFPIVEREDPSVLFTVRTDHLAAHAGQICFPGGRCHEADATLTATALREAEEETGISAGFVEITGFLDPFATGTGYVVHPVVAVLRPNFELTPNAAEVADVFEAPLAYLLDPAHHQRIELERHGTMRSFHAITYKRHTIWGATARMIVDLAQRLRMP